MSALLRVNGIDPASPRGAATIAGYTLDPFPGEAMTHLVGLAVRARLMGVAWAWQDVAAMHPVERRALLIAGEQSYLGQAAMAGEACSGPEGRARAAAPLDGGRALAALEARQTAEAFRGLRLATAEAFRAPSESRST